MSKFFSQPFDQFLNLVLFGLVAFWFGCFTGSNSVKQPVRIKVEVNGQVTEYAIQGEGLLPVKK